MAITRVGVATAAATTVTPPAHLAGDLIIIFAVHNGATTIPALPSGYTSILTKTGTSIGTRVGYKIATTTSDASGTWTNASILDCHVYRPSSGNTLGIGTSASIAQATLSVNFPALTLADGFSSNTWVLGFIGVTGVVQVCTVAPAGMTNESSLASTNSIAGFDTNGGVTTWASTSATDTGTASNSVSCTVELMLLPISAQPPHVVQHIGGGSFPPSVGSPLSDGNAFVCPFLNTVGSGNCLVLGITYPNGVTATLTDNINGAWAAAVTHANAGSGNMDSAIYVFPNSSAGQISITVTFSSSVKVFQYSLTEFSGIDPSPSAGSTNTANIAGPTAAAGSFTPTNNDSTGGNMVWTYVAESSSAPAHICVNIRTDQNLTLLDADVGWVNADGLFHASACYVQTTSAAINPTLTMIGDTDKFNSCAVALKLNAAAGTPAPTTGIRLVRLCHFTTDHFPTTGNYVLQSPTIGNLRVIACPDPNLNFGSIVVTDSEGNTWTAEPNPTGIYYFPNTVSNSNLQVTVTGGGTGIRNSWRFFDIIGAAVSPYDSSGLVSQTVNSLSSFTVSPGPTPIASRGIVLSCIGLGQGPGIGITSPAGAVWDFCTYGGSNTFTQTSSNNFIANDTMQVGNNTYKFVAAIGSTAGNVLIGANFAASISNLAAAVNLGAGSGTLYVAATNTPNITAFTGAGFITFVGNLANNNLAAGYPSVYTAAGTAAGTFAAASPFTTETDFDYIEDADTMAHYVFSAAGAQTWTFSISNVASNSTTSGFIVFKEAPAAVQTPYNPWPLRAPVLAQ